ncbi:S26 family signal peptidase [Sphingomonas abietis]|uniref:S26 family signal peptidase n=1 Tax=Sphingomonas abietis TaxID=3012344 RepID=A0ABY7NPB1_9SPHN|nr:S26 family signal peptidase [Sphingomonas abietis]WBO23367.1 S26 family signal peptidase [Sphingomonas abietis]
MAAAKGCLVRRWSIVLVGLAGVVAVLAPAVHRNRTRFLWNATASTPVGLYRVDPLRVIRPGVMIAVRPDPATAKLAAERHYLPLGLPLIKWVAAANGDLVCRTGTTISINGRAVGQARRRDHLGRPLPRWQGCVLLGHDSVFVMNTAVPDSFDGRYFGVLRRSAILGRAVPVWTEAHSRDPGVSIFLMGRPGNGRPSLRTFCCKRVRAASTTACGRATGVV